MSVIIYRKNNDDIIKIYEDGTILKGLNELYGQFQYDWGTWIDGELQETVPVNLSDIPGAVDAKNEQEANNAEYTLLKNAYENFKTAIELDITWLTNNESATIDNWTKATVSIQKLATMMKDELNRELKFYKYFFNKVIPEINGD